MGDTGIEHRNWVAYGMVSCCRVRRRAKKKGTERDGEREIKKKG